MKRAKSTDRSGGILKYVRRSPAENKTGNKANTELYLPNW